MPECFCDFFFKSGFITAAVSNVRRTGEDEPGKIFVGVKKKKKDEEEKVVVEEEDIID